MTPTIVVVGFDPNTLGMDLILGLGAVLAVVALVRGWRSFVDDDFTWADRRVATQVSVFLVPPVVVLLHELGHAVAAWLLGADVVGFHYGLFEGSVTVAGRLSPADNWFIALAGNAISAAMGFAMVHAGATTSSARRAWRYVLILGGMFEVLFALVGYPVLSMVTRFGDWLTVYDFSATPGLSSATLAVHSLLLWGTWRWWRGRLRPLLFAVANGQESRLAELQDAVRRNPADVGPRLELANLFAGRGELDLAAATLDEASVAISDLTRLHLARARLALYQGHWNQALLATRAGLTAAEPSLSGGTYANGHAGDLRRRLWAIQGLALSQMHRPDLALAAFEHVDGELLADARVRYGRGSARLASGDVQGGRADLAAVVASLPADDWLRRWAEARLEGREPAPPDDHDRPNWQRRQQAPPAPISGV